ncbi:hypothetical protein N9033_00215 [bacterium]|nr:hypothetical protein [bacterium]
MKLVKFKKITVQNFLSVGEEPVVINFTKGLNIITGINKDKSSRRNGVGKSTIADAIYFAIFGNTLRDIKKENIGNNITQKKPTVSVDLEISTSSGNVDQYKITRTLNPTKCYIYKNDNDITLDTINNTTNYISDLISASPELFQNCVIMTVNNTVPFMAKKKLDKRKFIESILNLEVFSDMLSYVRSQYNEAQRDLDMECIRYEEVSNQIQAIEQEKTRLQQENQSRINKIEERKKINTTSINELKSRTETNFDKSVSEYQEQVIECKNTLIELKTKRESSNQKIIELKASNKHLKSSHDKMLSKGSTCPVCLQNLNEHSHEKITKEKNRLIEEQRSNNELILERTKQLKLIDDVRDVVENKIDKIQNKINEQMIIVKEKDNTISKINQLQEWNGELNLEMKNLNTITDSQNDQLEKHTSRLQDVQKTINKHKDDINLIDIARFVVSEEGVKSYIVKRVLQLLNSKLSYYLKKMDSNCVCVFNEYFEEQIIDEKGKIMSYFNFSGAEKKNIDLACLFSFMDIRRLQGDVAFNLNIYDELFDSSLDEKGVELVVDILQERVDKFNESAMVISHRRDSTKIATGDIIFLQKEKGVTTRLEGVVN